MHLSDEQFSLLLDIQRKQLTVLERLAEAIFQLMPQALAPHYHYPLESFSSFDWESIGAKVEQIDSHGPAIVSWWGRQFIRRSPSNKFGDAIWFSRCIGVGPDGSNEYERLIAFRPQAKAEPLPPKIERLIS